MNNSELLRQLLSNDHENSPSFNDVVVFYNFVFEVGKSINPTISARKLLEREFAVNAPNYETGKIEIAKRFKKLITLRETNQETLEFLDTAMAANQFIEELQYSSDRSLFSPIYLAEIPFTRITLQPVFATVNGEDVSIDVLLLLHRTGVAVLTFAVVYELSRNASELTKILRAGDSTVENWEVVKDVIADQASSHGVNSTRIKELPVTIRISSGIEWVRFTDPINLVDLFEIHRIAIVSTLHSRRPKNLKQPYSWMRTPHWLAYPTLFVRRLQPSHISGTSFKEKHKDILANILLRLEEEVQLKPEIVQKAISKDFSLTDTSSYYVGSGHTTVIYYQSFLGTVPELP